MAASAASIGTLSVIIGGDARALDKMLAGAQNSITGFAAKVGQIAGGIGLVKAVESIASALIDNIKKGLDTASSLSKLAESSGEAVTEVSKLDYAMKIAAGSSDGLGRSLQSLGVGIADTAAGKVTDASNAIEAMGLKVRNADGSLKTSTQLLGDVAAKFATYKDGAGKAALAQALFGAGGESMIPLLNKGRDGLAQLGGEAEKFGLVLDGPAQEAVKSIDTNLAKLDATKQGLALTVAGKLAPAFAAITGAMLNIKTNSNLVEQASNLMAGAMKYVATIGLTVVTVFGRVTSSIGDLFTAAKFLAKGDFSAAWGTITASAGKSADAAISLKDTVTDLWSGVQKDAPAAAEAIKKVAPPMMNVGDAAKNALELYLDSSAKKHAAMIAEAATIGQTADVQARARVEEEAAAIVKAKNIKLTEDLRQRITDAGNAAAGAALALQGANVTQEQLTAQELRNQKLAQYATLLANSAISQETFNRAAARTQFPNFTAAAQSAMDMRVSVDQLATSMANGLANTLTQVITGAKSAGEAFAQFAVQVITDLVAMVVKAVIFKAIMVAIGFSGGGPVSPEALAVGAGTMPAMAGGGMISGPGTSTSDSIPTLLSDGEFVVNAAATRRSLPLLTAINAGQMPQLRAAGGMVSTPRVSVPQVPAPAAGGGGPVEATVHWRGGIADRRSLADLIDNLNGMFANGYRLKLQ